ncbi:CRISPR-associated endonuclease/helicase Cas3 [bacterium HR23]|nr:CRISPR-associated endonuclease/helicase Cas3 [bacterium HR23]
MAELLAKPDVGLIEHLGEVTRLGVEIARRLGLPEPLRVKALLACALHDIGKATTDFQEYIRGHRKKAYPHALASLPFVLLVESLLGQRYGWERHRLEATAAVLTHHSPLGPELYKGFEKPDYMRAVLPELLRSLFALLDSHGVKELPTAEAFWQSLQPLLANSPAGLLDTPLQFNGERRDLRGVLQRLPMDDFARVKAVLHLADWLASARMPEPGWLFLSSGASCVEAHIQRLGAPLRAFQRRAGETRSDVLWLRAPTGTGKTEALLLWAGDAERLLYLLPTQATTNAMWRRLRRIYGDEAVALAHGHASYTLRWEQDQDSLDARLLGSVFARPVTVATLDQYLLSHLQGRHWEERRTLARRATVVVDEVHAYEPYTLGLLLSALEREPPARLAVASATLPPALLRLFPHPQAELVEAEDALWRRTRHHLVLQDAPLEQCTAPALALARQGKRVLVVANTVGMAQRLYHALRQEHDRVLLLHSRFILRHRHGKERHIETAEAGTICIATQVVEVSLDISYDALFTEVAPLDALVQRMGRVNRRGDAPPAPVWVYCQPSEGAKRIYGQEVLEESLRLLRALPLAPTDRDLTEATHALYEKVLCTQVWQGELAAGRATLSEVQNTLGCYTIDLTDEEMQARFTARKGNLSVEVLPEAFVPEAFALKEKGEGWRIPELLVPVPSYWLRLGGFTSLSDLGCLQTTLPYDEDLGLVPPEGERPVEGFVLVH